MVTTPHGASHPDDSTPAVSLRPVGVSVFDEQVYLALLKRSDATPAALAESMSCSAGRVDRSMTRLRELGLVTLMSDGRRRHTAVDPEAAVEALIRDRTADLDAVRRSALALSSKFHAVRRQAGGGDTIEIVNGPEELGRWFVRLQHQVHEEMLVLDRPPYALAAVNPVEPVSLATGARWRAIYAPEALEIPGAMDEIQQLADRGEQGRVLPGLPLKLAIADRRIALMPLDLDIHRAQAAVIRESTLLDALVDLFDAYWDRAVPIGDSPTNVAEDDSAAHLPDARRLVQLLASGLTDSAIARQLGVSNRTVRRRISHVYDDLSAANRFQAGVQAARRGWI